MKFNLELMVAIFIIALIVSFAYAMLLGESAFTGVAIILYSY